jgi:hypothetical protein
MNSMATDNLKLPLREKAAALVEQLAEKCAQSPGIGSFTPSVYDTAWVAMIPKTADGETRWLFPKCFQLLLDSQLPEGGWDAYASEVDGILNTMAALLALKKHANAPQNTGCALPDDLELRISRATVFLGKKLQHWQVEASIHVGFEILVPALLRQLELESIFFEFPGRRSLLAINDKKLARFDPRMLYRETKTTLIHSLEAFIGGIDFDKVAHHKAFGSMMASPSSTAAYLMHCSTWDDEAEAYIQNVINFGTGRGSGGVPSAFPATVFELAWV